MNIFTIEIVNEKKLAKNHKTMKLALDWTPNVNHIGILIAKEKRFFEENGVTLELVSPDTDNYTLTPGKRLATNLVDFAIAPFETVISLNNKSNPIDAVALYAILQKDLSCIATLSSSGLSRPAHLAGKKYASYAARYEDKIVQEMIKEDGGLNEVNCIYPEKLGIWNTLLTNEADATWIFDNWEGVEASTMGITLNKFRLHDYHIPYGYSPIIIARKKDIDKHKEVYKAVVNAIKRGYEYASNHQQEAASILSTYVTEHDRLRINLNASIQQTVPYFNIEYDYGYMKQERVEAFLQWLVENKLESGQILQQVLYTNDLLN